MSHVLTSDQVAALIALLQSSMFGLTSDQATSVASIVQDWGGFLDQAVFLMQTLAETAGVALGLQTFKFVMYSKNHRHFW